jgi:hypothetical protein
METKSPASFTELNLSEALLAPLNAIFEAQVHAARSFLSFILQMGFRHKYSKEEIDKLKENETDNKDILDNIKAEQNDRKEIDKLRKLQKDGTITEEQLRELKLLLNKWDDLHSQDFIYIDDNGNENWVTVPNLALIPVKPLAIDTAQFKFDMAINEKYENYNTIKDSAKADYERPWFLIQPKRLTGRIVPQNSTDSQASISIEIKIKSTEMPNGLNRLLTMMNESSRILPVELKPVKTSIPDQPD